MIHNSRTIINTGKHLLQGCALFGFAAAALLAPTAAQAQSLKFVPVITTFSGTGTNGYLDGSATTALYASPHISDTDPAGNLYVPDTTNNVVRRVDVNGNTCTYAGYASTGAVCPGMPASGTGAATVAGHACVSGSVYTATDTVGDGCPATQAILNNLKALRLDPFGNVVIADVNNNRIRSINASTGIITTIVGTGAANNGTPFTNGTLATSIKLYDPFDLNFDKSGNLYISDINDNYVVMVLAVNGAITSASTAYIIAGTGVAGYNSSDGAVASTAELDLPRGLAIDAAGNIFIADYTNNAIRKVTSPFTNGVLTLSNSFISTYAGNGTQGTAGTAAAPCCTGDGGPALQAAISNPQGLTLDAAGNLYIAQFSPGYESIREVNAATHIITTVAGNGVNAHTGDGAAATAATLYSPAGLSFDRNGRMLIDDSSNNRIRLVMGTSIFSNTSVGVSSTANNVVALATAAVTPKTVSVTANSKDFTTGTVTGTGCTLGAAAVSGAFCSIPVTFKPALPGVRTTVVDITDSAGNNSYTGVIGIGNAPEIAFTPATIATIAGTGTASNTGNGSAASLATVNAPRGSAFDASGSLVFADSGSNVIRRIDHTTNVISVLAGGGAVCSGKTDSIGDGCPATQATLNAPTDVVMDFAGNLYISDTGNNCIREVNAVTGIITIVAGTTTANYTGDTGLATAATLNGPTGLAMDFAGRIYVADTNNNVVRRFVPNGGYIVTIAGTGTANYSGDTGAATAARLSAPTAVTLDTAGDIFIADTGNNVVRKISPLGIISTYAGTHGVTSNSGDGAAATSAGLQGPTDVALDPAGDLYIASGGLVRFVNAAGTITTIAGTGATGVYSGEGGPATQAVIPSGANNISVDGAGNVYISATTANLILNVSAATAPTVNFGLQALNVASAAQIVTVQNTGNQPLVLSGLTVSSPYTLNSSSTACTATSTVAAGASCTLAIVFTPTVSGTTTGSVVIKDNTLNGAAVTQTISLTGNSGNPTTTTLTTNPTSLTYGQSIILSASVTGTALTGNITFTVDGVTVGTKALTSGSASITLAQLSAGKRTITATYGNDTVNAGSYSTVTVNVTPAVLTVTANNVTQNAGTAIPSLGYTISGYLYTDNISVISGTAVFTTTATTTSAAGPYPITFSSSTLSATNYTFNYVGGTFTLIPPDFSITVSPASATITAGQTTTTIVTLTPLGSYSGTVTLTCPTLPLDATCSFSASPLVASGSGAVLTSQLLIASDNFNHVAGIAPASKPGHGIGHWMPLSLAALPLLMLCGLRKKRTPLRTLLAILLLLAAGGITACANSGLNIASTGTASITVTGADGNNLSHSAVFTLTLQ